MLSIAIVSFLSTSSARRTTELRRKAHSTAHISIHVLREEDDGSRGRNDNGQDISIHVLREEDDRPCGCIGFLHFISIHVLREEDDLHSISWAVPAAKFLSTSSARRTTRMMWKTMKAFDISIHVLREEDDNPSLERLAANLAFLSTSSARRTTVILLP